MKLTYTSLLTAAALSAFFAVTPSGARAHGTEGNRYFPPTILTEDPFAVDELAGPTVSTFRSPDDPDTRETDVGIELTKEILPGLALGVSSTHIRLAPDSAPSASGFDNFAISLKKRLWESAPDEAIVSAGAEWEIGGTGSNAIGAAQGNRVSTSIFFGKGLGGPLAVTGSIGATFPGRSEPDHVEWGFALEYSIPYLQSHIRDIGLSEPFKGMIPVVEISLETPVGHGGGPTTGTIAPGILWSNRHLLLGAEALIPANSSSGHHVGVAFKLQLFIDDVWPGAFGHPLISK